MIKPFRLGVGNYLYMVWIGNFDGLMGILGLELGSGCFRGEKGEVFVDLYWFGDCCLVCEMGWGVLGGMCAWLLGVCLLDVCDVRCHGGWIDVYLCCLGGGMVTGSMVCFLRLSSGLQVVVPDGSGLQE